MKKITILLSALMLVSGTFLSAQTIDDVLKEHFKAIGQEKLLKVNTIKTTGKLITQGMEIAFIQMSKRPNCVRVEGTLQGMSFVQTYNGTEGWDLNPMAGVTEPQPMNEDALKAMKFSADIDGMLWNWKAKGYTVTLDGKEDMEGTSCFKVKLVTQEKGGDTFTFYLDADSYMMIRTNTKIKMQGNESESDTYYSNYLQVEGLAMPGKIDTKMGGQIAMTIVTDKFELNLDLDKSLFEKPVK